MNSDRNASLTIAAKFLFELKNSPNQETFQISNRQVSVNGLIRSNAVVAVRHVSSTYGEPTPFTGAVYIESTVCMPSNPSIFPTTITYALTILHRNSFALLFITGTLS